MPSCVSALLFAKRLGVVAEFYQAVFGARISHSDASHAVLDFDGFNLMIHQLPAHLAVAVAVKSPPERREQTAIRLDYPVEDLARSRSEAARLGGVIDESPPPWAANDTKFFLGHDPEGNVFGVKMADNG
jgi:predicted enzyme related to lactoylglutathione lyase